MGEYRNGLSLAYWEGALSAWQDETHKLESAVGMEFGESRMSSRVRQFAALLDRAKQQEQHISELESIADLYEALELLVDTNDNGGWPSAAIVVARAALAKARGEQ